MSVYHKNIVPSCFTANGAPGLYHTVGAFGIKGMSHFFVLFIYFNLSTILSMFVLNCSTYYVEIFSSLISNSVISSCPKNDVKHNMGIDNIEMRKENNRPSCH